MGHLKNLENKDICNETTRDSENKKLGDLSIVMVGHVDHGKSTVIGRMLADTHSLPSGKLEQVKEKCKKNSKPFEYAFLLDALKDEQEQGITIDVARIFFRSNTRNYIILDAPGHIEFLKNMVTGAARADAAFLVIDAKEGIQENSKRHGYMLYMLGMKKVTVIINKMDLVDYSQKVFDEIVRDYTKFLSSIHIQTNDFIPVSGFQGDNIVQYSDKMTWYKGKTVLEKLDSLEEAKQEENLPFRMPVQGIYKFTNEGDNRRIIAGNIETGKIKVGDTVVFYPSGKKTTVKTIEGFNTGIVTERSAGYDCGFTMTEQLYLTRGEIGCKADEKKPMVGTRVKANIFWLGNQALEEKKRYLFKLGTMQVHVLVEGIESVLNADDLSRDESRKIEKHKVGECILSLEKAIAFDLIRDIDKTSRFVIVDDYKIAGGGIIHKVLDDEEQELRNHVMYRNYKWESSHIVWEERARRYNQKPCLVVINGPKGSIKKELAKKLEEELFLEGKFVYYMGMSNILYSVDADIKVENSLENKDEQIRRMAEVINIMLETGLIIVLSTQGLTEKDLLIMNAIIWTDDIYIFDTELSESKINSIPLSSNHVEHNVYRIKKILMNSGVILKI
jgi:bifunctional enzyme CysN/CysC